ncbi:MAG: right-handed parallel beta-helix repeat-containing protein [Trichloromonadaceae bacterium]
MRLPIWLLLTLWLSGCAHSLSPALPSAEKLATMQQLQGVLQGETILSGSLYLADDVLVPKGSTLVLRAGTTVYVRVTESTKIDPEYLSAATELLVRGSLRIEGAADQPVRFVPVSEQTKAVLWSGITLDGASDSRISGLELHQAETGVLCINTSPVIADSRFIGCRYGVIAQRQSSPQILGNQIRGGEGGIFCWRDSHPLIENNQILDNNEEGVFVDASSRPQLRRNRIEGNDIGLALYPRRLEMTEGQARNNGRDLVWLGSDPPGGR